MASQLHISISAEPIFHIGSIVITNSILTSWIVSAILIAVSLWAAANVKKTNRPTGLQNLLEMIVEGLHGLTQNITESERKTKTIFPFVFGFFLFIVLNNWFGLLPGVGTIGIREGAEPKAMVPAAYASKTTAAETKEAAPAVNEAGAVEAAAAESEPAESHAEEGKFVPLLRAGTADLNTTLALALISVISTQIVGIKYLGLGYFKKFINLKGPIDAFVGFLEAVSEVSKILSFSFRLFGNVFAGEVLLAVISFLALGMIKFLVPGLLPLPFYLLELFVGAVQAFVFAMLTLVFMNMATQGHGEHEEHA